MGSYFAFFILITVAFAPVLSAPVPDQINIRNVQYNDLAHPGIMEKHVSSYPTMPILRKRSMLDFGTLFETRNVANLPDGRSASVPTRTYSKRVMNFDGISKAFSFFRDIMDEGVAIDATSSDALHLKAGSEGSSDTTSPSPSPTPTPNIVNHSQSLQITPTAVP